MLYMVVKWVKMDDETDARRGCRFNVKDRQMNGGEDDGNTHVTGDIQVTDGAMI